jgi:hemoglobin
MSSMTSIYEAIGGTDAVSLAVDAFYDRVLADPLLLPLFTNTAIPRLKSHQKAFFTWVLGGPNAYQGRPIKDAHAGMGITTEQFTHVAGHLADTLISLNVPQVTVDQVIGKVATLRKDIVERP